MKKLLTAITIMLMVSALNAGFRIVKATNGKELTIPKLARDLLKYDVIFFGEEHGVAEIHALQRELLPYLQDSKRKLILSFEMWERDTQDVMDQFLAGQITEDEFIELSRVWPGYEQDYRPLIMYAKEHQLPVVAANVPTNYSGQVTRNSWDFIADLPESERRLIASEFSAPQDAYYDAFMQTMQTIGGHHIDPQSLEYYYQAQCLKDDTMAESIYIALDYYKKARILHFNGAFHSQGFLGTVSRLQQRLPKLKIAVITPVRVADSQNHKATAVQRSAGTHLLLMDEVEAQR
ncbi:MAG TPA: ChaN family lipoprotein, partial [Candidatus Cloacimonadota bacterium]|nr:ChaN family lipoprotein [Candidatus Cloacimonadota bacterium]